MKSLTLPRASMVGAILLAVSGCNAANDTTAAPAPVTVTVTATPSESPAAATTESSSEASSAVESGPRMSSRGNVIKRWGDKGGVGASDGSDARVVEFILNEPAKNFTCTGQYASAPENGVMVAIPAELTLAPGAEAAGFRGDLLHPVQFRFVGADGKTASIDMQTSAALQCVDEEDAPNFNIGDGETTSGLITLDLPASEGTLILDDALMDGGWEWEL